MNQGILQSTGFVNSSHINQSGVWSLGLLQMDFFYRRKLWYAGQFVRKIIPKFKLSEGVIHFVTTALNTLKNKLLTVLVRNVDDTFLSQMIQLPSTEDGKIDFVFMNEFISKLISFKTNGLNAYLSVTGLKGYELTDDEKKALDSFSNLNWKEWEFLDLFNNIKQGRRLKKEDQIKGAIPFVMAGTSNTGVVDYISNPVAIFPKNSITIDIFGNTFYRNYIYGAGDDTGVYWNDMVDYSTDNMLFFATSMKKSISGLFSFGKKLRSSQSLHFKIQLPSINKTPDYEYMEIFIRAIKKLIIKDVVLRANEIINATTLVFKR